MEVFIDSGPSLRDRLQEFLHECLLCDLHSCLLCDLHSLMMPQSDRSITPGLVRANGPYVSVGHGVNGELTLAVTYT
jgi:hypothetical protein